MEDTDGRDEMAGTKRLAIAVAVVALGTTMSACGANDSRPVPRATVPARTTSSAKATTPTRDLEEKTRGGDKPNSGKRYPKRANRQREDQERVIGGEPARLAGFSAWVFSGGWQQSVSSSDNDGYVKIAVKILNRDKAGAPRYDARDWSLQTPRVQIIEPNQFVRAANRLGSGTLGWGRTAEGTVYFDTPREVGDYYVIYKPKALDAAQGIWRIRVD